MLAAHGQSAPSTPRLAAGDLRSPCAARVFGELAAWESELTAWWELCLQVGGFPQAVSAQLGGLDPAPVVQALFDVIHRDAFGATATSEPQVAALLARIASNIASPMNVSTAAADVAVSPDAGTRRLSDLVTSYLLWTCPAGVDQRPVLRSQAKRYFTDPLPARLAHLRNPAVDSPDTTRLTEQQLGTALLRSAEAAAPGTYTSFDQVLYERTKTRKEIDLVGPLLAPVAIEARYTDTGRWQGEAVTVNASPYAGVLATRGVLDTSASSPTAAWAVPASLLAFSIDV